MEGILESAGADFSMKDLLAKLRTSLLVLPACPLACLSASASAHSALWCEILW